VEAIGDSAGPGGSARPGGGSARPGGDSAGPEDLGNVWRRGW